MILLLGASGYMGEAFAKELQRRKKEFVPLSRKQVDYTRFDSLLEFLKSKKPEFVVNAAGYTGKPNVDACELAKADTLAGNTLLPQTIAQACAAAGIPWGHVSSGCIFSGAKVVENGVTKTEKAMTQPGPHAVVEKAPEKIHGFTETDAPNFSFRDGPCSFYSGTKALAEEAITGVGQSYIWRLRIPFDEFDNARNYLSKVQRYSKVYDNVNSVSHRADFVRACLDLWEKRAPFGIYNVTNQGFVTTRQVVALIEKILKPNRKFEFWKDDSEFYKQAAKTPRSNCVMDVSKLLAAGVKIRDVHEALEDSLKKLESRKMNLLITGGAGFIGSNVIHHVIDRPEVTKLVNLDCLTYAGHLANLTKVSKHQKYVFEKVDLRDKAETLRVVQQHKISHVMHLAAESHVDRSISGPGDFIHTNVNGTFNLLEDCRVCWGSNESRFHHVSTDEVFGSLGATGYFTETTPYAPNSPYSASKASSDMLVRAYHHTYGLQTVITNCSNNYGPLQFPEKLIPVVIQSAIARKSIPVYGDGMNVRDWLYVRDHAEALWTVLLRGKVGETYNIGGHNEWANIHIVEIICDLIDEFKPELGGQSRKLITYVKDRLGHDRRYAIDAAKIERELGWTPAHKFEDGIRETVRWYLDNQEWVKTVLAEKV